jgi:hypothetical protein
MSKSFFVVVFLLLCFMHLPQAVAEEITLSTYYPAPYGEYDFLSADTGVDIGSPRLTGSSLVGLNIHDSADGGIYTNMHFAQRAWSGSHAILFNALKRSTQVNGSLLTTGNTIYANNVGAYGGGAGGIFFNGNGGNMHLACSPASTGQGNNINWGTPQVTIQRNGRVGIGTSTPQTKLHLLVPDNEGIRIQAGESGWGPARIEFYSDPIGNTNEWRPGYITSADSGAFTGRLDFYTNGTGHAQRIGSVRAMSIRNGRVGIGTTSPAAELHVINNQLLGNIAGNDAHWLHHSGSGNFYFGRATGGNGGWPSSWAYLSAGGVWTNASSIEYKKNIRSLDEETAVEVVANLRPVIYQLKESDDTEHVGFIAEEVPDLVASSDRKGVSAIYIVSVLTKVVQQQQQRIEQLEARLDEKQDKTTL